MIVIKYKDKLYVEKINVEIRCNSKLKLTGLKDIFITVYTL